MRAILAIVLAAGAIAWAGCETAAPSGGKAGDTVPQLDAATAAAAGLRAQEADDGKALYVAKCARCHKFYDPAQYGEREWQGWMAKMSRKARLKPEQQELLSRYLGVYRAEKMKKEGGAEAR